MKSINPFNKTVVAEYAPHDSAACKTKLEQAADAFTSWSARSFNERARVFTNAARLLRGRKKELSNLITLEMGKLLAGSIAEVEKCALACDYYAQHAEAMLAQETLHSDAARSYVRYDPLGPVLAIMPWNFPFWQVFRFAAPNLMAGNVAVVKHASNVSGCALAIEALVHDAGLPEHCYTALLIPASEVESIIASPHIAAVTLTGSEAAGRDVAAQAGRALKKTVLELGGSDPYLVLADADIEKAAAECAQSRMINSGQSCIAAKRFIVEAPVHDVFVDALRAAFAQLTWGDPRESSTALAPLARHDLRDEVHHQVQASIRDGASLLMGGSAPDHPGAFYLPTILTGVTPGMAAFDEEIFGPVAAISKARDADEAIALANRSRFGLGAAIFTQDIERAHILAARVHSGQVFINAFVRSDPRMPFGGVKHSGYGREMGMQGIREFMNAKTVVAYQ